MLQVPGLGFRFRVEGLGFAMIPIQDFKGDPNNLIVTPIHLFWLCSEPTIREWDLGVRGFMHRVENTDNVRLT